MASDKVEMARRIEVARPGDTVRGLIFNAVLRLVREKEGPERSESLRERVLTRAPVDFFSYPVKDFLRLLYEAADVLEPHYGSPEAAIRACGAAAVSGFFNSGVGQTLTNLIGKDPKKLFSSAPTAYSTTVSYGTREFIQLSEKKVRLVFKEDMQPVAFHEGTLGEALKAMGATGSVLGTPQGYDGAEYLIEWS